ADQLPIAFLGVLHGGDGDRTDFLLDQIVKPRLEAVDGVSKVDIFGVLDDSVRILLDEERTMAASLDVGNLIGRLNGDNFTLPLGEVDDGGQRYLLRSDMRFADEDEVEDYPIGGGLTIGDVGSVIRAKSVRNQLNRIDGDYSYFGIVRKESQANVVATSRAMEVALRELAEDPRLNGEISFLEFFVQGRMIENSLVQLRSTAMWGGALALAVLLIFLRRIRLTLCVALSIPVSALSAITWEYFTGGSFNILTMTGITLGIGMLVDNAVVMVENIARHRSGAAGEVLDGARAARRGASEIALAVTLATLTTVVVFLPLIFMSSNPMARTIFGGIGIPLCVSLMFSLLIAVVFLPVVSARILGDRPPALERGLGWLAPIGRIPGRLVEGLLFVARWVGFGLATLLHGLGRLALGVLAPRHAALAWGARLVRLAAGLGVIWVALEVDRNRNAELEAFGSQWLPGGAGASSNQALTLGVVAALGLLLVPELLRTRQRRSPVRPRWAPSESGSLLDLVIGGQRRLVRWAIDRPLAGVALAFLCFASIGVPMDQMELSAFSMDDSGDSVRYWVRFDGDFTLREASDEMRLHEDYLVQLKEDIGAAHYSTRFDDRGGTATLFWDEPLTPTKRDEYRKQLREGAPSPPGHTLSFADQEQAGDRSKEVATFVLRGPDSRVLEELATDAVAILSSVPGLRAVSTPLQNAPEQLEVELDRDQALALGVDSQLALNNIVWTLRGFPLPRFAEEGRELPFLIEFDRETTAGLSTLRDLQLWTGDSTVSLASVGDFNFSRASSTIYRENGQTTFRITAEITDPLRATQTSEAGYAALGRLDLPRGYSLGTDSSARSRQQEEASEMLRAMLLSVVLVFLLMGILFESVVLPFSVLFTIPFAILGALWTIYLTQTPMDVMGWIGLIILAGVVVNNGIVLIDRVHRLRDEGMPRDEAVVEGVAQRVRPVLMTALTTITGLLPMILAEPPTDSIDYRSLGTIVAGGLAASTFFTLWVVPLVYVLIDRASGAVSGAVRSGVGRRAAPSPRPA
ncbi:MAG: efflux RND transporter permease subunit, partial [Planctomycetota bacterium]